MKYIGKFKDLEIYLGTSDIYIGDFEEIRVYANTYGLNLFYFNQSYLYIYGKGLKTQLSIVKERSGHLVLYGSGFWGIDYYENKTTFNIDKFRKFIFNNELIKEILLLEDILE